MDQALHDGDNSRILELLISMFSGDKDEYAKETVPPLALTFDRVNEGRAPRTSAHLFRLPIEILAVILQYIPASM